MLEIVERINVLLVDDDPDDAFLMDDYLGKLFGSNYALTTCIYMKDALVTLKNNAFQIIIADLHLPDSSGLESFTTLFKTNPECPIIILTGLNDESIGVKAVQLGAQDFLIKGELSVTVLKKSISHSMERFKLLKVLAENTLMLEKKTTDLFQKQQQFEEAQKMVHLGSWEWDIHSGTVCWSDELFRIFRLTPQLFSPTSESIINHIHPDDKKWVAETVNLFYQDKIAYSIKHRIVCTDGMERIVHQEAQSITTEDGNIIKMYGTLLDITEQKLLEEVAKATEIADQLTVAKDQFLATMSHEIRTPLNGIIGFTKLLLRDSISETQRKQLQAIKSSSDILLVLINDILDLSKIESGKIHIEETELKLNELVTTVMESFELRFEEKRLVVTDKYDNAIPQILMGDPVRIEQILLNLLSNSLKFTDPEGYITIQTILIAEDEEKATIEFIITDTGIGIAPEKVDMIFEPFVQANNDTTRKYGGTGLGLSIVKRLVDLMGGTISIKSKLNHGTIFTFTLLLRKTIATEVSKEIKTRSRLGELKELGTLRILIAEDEMINSFLLETIFGNHGFEVDAATNGKAAIELLKKYHYDIMLMDLMMPEMDGYETAKFIRKKIELPKSTIPIIALTADVTKQVKIKCTEAGMNEYISKPFNETELLNKIIRLVKQSKAHSSIPNLFS